MKTIQSDNVRRIEIQLNSGSIRLSTSESDATHGEIRADNAETEERVEVTKFGDSLRIETPRDARKVWDKPVHVALAVVPGTHLQINGGSCDVSADVKLGTVNAKVGSGDMQFAAADYLNAKAGSGDIEVITTTGDAKLVSGSGDLEVGTCGGRLDAITASGDVMVGTVTGGASLKSASGDIDVRSTAGSIDAKSSSGDVSVGVAGDLPAWLDLKSGSGDVDIAIPPTRQPEPGQPYVSIVARSGSGDITVVRA